MRAGRSGRQKTLGWTGLRRLCSSKLAAAWALQLSMQIHYLRWLHRSGVVRQETGERAGHLLEMRRPNRQSTKEYCLTCVMNTVEGTLIVGTVVKWFIVFAKGERKLEPSGSGERKHNLSYQKSGITMARRPC